MTAVVADYKRKRDYLCAELAEKFELVPPGGAFYVFPKVPRGTGTQFVEEAVRHNLLVIPGIAFGRKDTHIRISYAAPDDKLRQGVEILRRLAG